MRKIRSFILVMCCLLMISSLVVPSTVNASTVTQSGSVNAEIESQNSPYGVTLRSRGSCEELVRRGLLSSRSCGSSGGRPNGGKVFLTTEQWNCVLEAFGEAAAVAVNLVSGGVWLVASISGLRTINSCRGI